MKRKKFNFKQAIQEGGAALVGGVIAGKIVTGVQGSSSELLANQAVQENVDLIPAILGLWASQQKNKTMSAAGLGMVGASADRIFTRLGVGVTGVGKSGGMTVQQRRAYLHEAAKRGNLPVAGASGVARSGEKKTVLAAAMDAAL